MDNNAIVVGSAVFSGVFLLLLSTYLSFHGKNCSGDSCKKTKNLYVYVSAILGLLILTLGCWLFIKQN